MAALGAEMSRTNSSDSSALSNILVAAAAQTEELEQDSESEAAEPLSTPPTSVQDSASNASAANKGDEEGLEGRRSRRARSGVGSYNLKTLMDAQESGRRDASGLTGRTLVEGEEESFEGKMEKALDMEWALPAADQEEAGSSKVATKLPRKASVKDRVKKVAGKVGAALGKRKRDVAEAAGRRFGKGKATDAEEVEEEVVKKSKWERELDTGVKGVLDEIDLDGEFEAPPARPAKKAKMSKDVVPESSKPLIPTKPTAAPVKSVRGKGEKKWQTQGLYVGQSNAFDPLQVGRRKKLQKKRPGTAGSESTNATEDTPAPAPAMTSGLKPDSFITLPMFAYLDKVRDFRIPFDVYAPATKKGDEKPKDWHKVNRNRLVGEAKDLWAKVEKLPPSICACKVPEEGQTSCDDDCLNRIMQYECNEDNCALAPDQCSNRAFGELAARIKKGGAFDVGVEVLKTDKRGFGVRSSRSFQPGQIIMEYTGEIISEGECQRRMREEYKDKQCYYLMELERGLIIDGTKGSMARFINHSCAPNCEVRMLKVNGTPRMAVFAGDHGVMTGEELTYDYNFDNFGTTQQQCFCGAESCRGFLSKRLNAAEVKRLAREEEAKRLKVAEEARQAAEREAKRRKVVEGRGSGWRGWVAVDDPETKERLREEKRARDEAERSSGRAMRLAARRGSLPAGSSGVKEGTLAKVKEETVAGKKRRRTVQVHQEVLPVAAFSETPEVEEEAKTTTTKKERKIKKPSFPRRTASASASAPPPSRSASLASKFHEEFTPAASPATKEADADNKTRPLSAQTMNTTITRKTEVSISTTTEVLQSNAEALSPRSARLRGNGDTAAGADVEQDAPVRNKAKGNGLKRRASKGKAMVKQAIKGSLGSSSSAVTPGRFRQTTLTFGKAD